jgi:hypothetical protein
MKDSKIYLQAAQLIDQHKESYSCLAIASAAGRVWWENEPLAVEYCKHMGFVNNDLYVPMMKKAKRRNLRVWLLLLASAIAKSEGN